MENWDPKTKRYMESLLNDHGLGVPEKRGASRNPMIGSISVRGNVIFIENAPPGVLEAALKDCPSGRPQK